MICSRAFDGGTPLGSALIVHHGDTAEYLAGTLLDAGRPFSIGQLLLWRAIEDARSAGLRRFDLGGMDAERTPRGIYDFKRGVSGAPYRLMPEIEARPTGLRARLVRWRVRRARGENSVPATAP
jgi:lipid II:glycine glycyltransferase (peptidoglycan interpeptide bridge formation enzyme)